MPQRGQAMLQQQEQSSVRNSMVSLTVCACVGTFGESMQRISSAMPQSNRDAFPYPARQEATQPRLTNGMPTQWSRSDSISSLAAAAAVGGLAASDGMGGQGPIFGLSKRQQVHAFVRKSGECERVFVCVP